MQKFTLGFFLAIFIARNKHVDDESMKTF